MDANEIYPAPGVPESAAKPSHTRRGPTFALVAVALVLCTAGGAAGGLAIASAFHNNSDVTFAPPNFNGSTWQSGSQETTSTATSSQLIGLVRIQTTLGYQDGAAVGTGMILTSSGEVVTNHHVIQGATKIRVTVMSTGQQFNATLVGSDSTDDVAVLQLQGASGLATIHPSTASVAVGQTITAVGDAQGATTFTSAPGKVTAVDQTISPADSSSSQRATLTGVMQYAADVMSGDSGGATYDSSGAVVGMTTAASAGGIQTNGYAIPIAKVLSVASDLEGHVSNAKYVYGLPAFIGVGVNPTDVVLQVFPGTGAATSGLKRGDRIIAVDGTGVSKVAQLQAATRSHQIGDDIKVTWTTSSGTHQSATIRLIAGPAA